MQITQKCKNVTFKFVMSTRNTNLIREMSNNWNDNIDKNPWNNVKS